MVHVVAGVDVGGGVVDIGVGDAGGGGGVGGVRGVCAHYGVGVGGLGDEVFFLCRCWRGWW